MSEFVRVESADGLAVVTLDNAKTRNALSRELLLELADKLEVLRADDGCRALVLTGAHGHFCSGGDVSGMAAQRTLPMGRERMLVAHRIVRLITGMGKPVVAAVEGYAAGAGFSLALAADCVVAADSAKFVSSFAKVSLLPDLGLMWTLPQRIGLARAKRLLMSARVVAADEALRIGLVDEVAPAGQAVAQASGGQRALAASFAALQWLLPWAVFALAAWLGPRRTARNMRHTFVSTRPAPLPCRLALVARHCTWDGRTPCIAWRKIARVRPPRSFWSNGSAKQNSIRRRSKNG